MTTISIVVDGGCLNNNLLDMSKRQMYFSMAVLLDDKPVVFHDIGGNERPSPFCYRNLEKATENEVRSNNVAELIAMESALLYLEQFFERTTDLNRRAFVEIWTDSADVFGWLNGNKVKAQHLVSYVEHIKNIHKLLALKRCMHSIVLKPRAEIVAILGH